MSDVDRFLKAFIAQHESGGDPDPAAFAAELEGVDRSELEALIAGYLERAPRPWSPDAFRGSRAEAIAEDLSPLLDGGRDEAGPGMLADLRRRAELRRGQVVGSLVAALGLAGGEEKVAYYYHRMESGLLPERGISARIFDALGEILDRDPGELREAVAGRGETTGAASAMARTVTADPAYVEGSDADDAGAPALPARRDEVDELFTGG